MTKHQNLMLKRHLKVSIAAYEESLRHINNMTSSERAMTQGALDDAKEMLDWLNGITTFSD